MTTDYGVTIRAASQADVPTLLDLYRHLDQGEPSRLTLADAERLFSRIESYPDYTIYLATLDDKPVGTYALMIMDNIEHHGTPCGIVEGVVVDPQIQGKGIGKQMMQHAMQICREKGCYKLALSSNLKRTDAHQFYESLGFEKHGFSFQIPLSPC